VSWADRAALSILLALAPAAAGCSPTPILEIDQEIDAIDLDACARGVAPCVRTGDVRAVSVLLPGEAREVELGVGASIEGPLGQPSSPGTLEFLGLGLNTLDGDCSLEITLIPPAPDAEQTVTIAPWTGMRREEIDLRGWASRSGARLRLRAVKGRFDVTYAAGRWRVP
jgi:hypothetical protein